MPPLEDSYASPQKTCEDGKEVDSDRRWNCVRLALTPFDAPEDKREVTLWEHSNISLGRSSKSGGFYPDNLRVSFRNPVVSRRHAELQLFVVDGRQDVMVVDQQSMHGTYVGDHRLEPFKPWPIFSGDCLRFGGLVTKGQKAHEGVVLLFEKLESSSGNGKLDPTPNEATPASPLSRGFRVPSDSEDASSCSDDDYSDAGVDLWSDYNAENYFTENGSDSVVGEPDEVAKEKHIDPWQDEDLHDPADEVTKHSLIVEEVESIADEGPEIMSSKQQPSEQPSVELNLPKPQLRYRYGESGHDQSAEEQPDNHHDSWVFKPAEDDAQQGQQEIAPSKPRRSVAANDFWRVAVLNADDSNRWDVKPGDAEVEATPCAILHDSSQTQTEEVQNGSKDELDEVFEARAVEGAFETAPCEPAFADVNICFGTVDGPAVLDRTLNRKRKADEMADEPRSTCESKLEAASASPLPVLPRKKARASSSKDGIRWGAFMGGAAIGVVSTFSFLASDYCGQLLEWHASL